MHIYDMPEKIENAGETVRKWDGKFESELSRLAEEILGNPQIKLLGLTGPTCSGKTTAAGMLTNAIESAGREVHIISVDNFFYGKDYLLQLSRKKGRDEPDYDSPSTIDLNLLRTCVQSLLAGRKTEMPKFNFYTGMREKGETFQAQKGDIFLFEGIQILYPQVDGLLRGEGYFNFCVCPQSAVKIGDETFRPNEIRLLRRLVRDFLHRGADPSFTFYLWDGVRENEEQNIFPYMHTCNKIIDTTMPYEIGMLKPYLLRILTPERTGQYDGEAREILKRLEKVEPLSDTLLQPHSLYKEFI